MPFPSSSLRSWKLPPPARVTLSVISVSAVLIAGCGTRQVHPRDGGSGDAGDAVNRTSALRLNEIMSNDDGTAIDEQGEVEDWIELINSGTEPIELAGYTLTDGDHPPQPLPALSLAPGATVLFWADQSPEQGARHLSFKISSAGDHIVLADSAGRLVDDVTVGTLEINQAYARFPDGTGVFARCNYATPARTNGAHCGPPKPPGLPADLTFAPFTWPAEVAAPPLPLAITQAALFPARFVEVQNSSAAEVDLARYEVRLQPTGPGTPLPGRDAGTPLAWTVSTLAAGARTVLLVPAAAQAALDANPEREGMLSIFSVSAGGAAPSMAEAAVERVDFMRWPDQAVLVREQTAAGALGSRFRFCEAGTSSTPVSSCQPLATRAVGDRLRHLRTADDFTGLAAGTTELASQSVKFVVDMEAADTVHFLGSRRWDLHYRFIRERIYGQPALDRCDPLQAAQFREGWIDFSLREYFKVQRRFLLGTLVRWGGSGLSTVEFAVGDVITGEQMRRAFFAVMAHVSRTGGGAGGGGEGTAWAVRPQAPDQVDRIRAVEGTLPIVDPKAPFRNQTFQPLVAATGYGVLRFVPGSELAAAALGPDVIVVTDEVPNDIPLVGGLITEAFQTPLAHVAVLSKNRGTPNMALVDAHTDPRLAPFLNRLVRFEVSGAGFTFAEALPAEATAFWDKLRPKGPRLAPRLDTTVRDLVDLTTGSLDDLPAVGAKAAQIGELYRLSRSGVSCPTGLPLPRAAMALPVVHYREHFERSGAAALLAARSADPAFAADPRFRAQALGEVRAAIASAAVEPGLLQALRAQVEQRFGSARVRLRSSSNTEDLPGFTGAGLYTSVSVAVDDPHRDLAEGLKTVWASLWQPRAYDERELALVDHARAAMGVLIEPAFTNERANGVAVSRNVLDPIYGDAYYFNAQAGEASVTNPAPGVTSEQGTFQATFPLRIDYISRSSLISAPVLTSGELETLMCALGAIHQHFRARLDPMHLDRWFAMDIEWKLIGPERQLVVKQARPYSFGRADIPTDCREF